MAETTYCAIADVQRLVKRVQFGDTSKVTIQDVQDYIDETSRIIDGRLRTIGISTPITYTATISRNILKILCAYGAAAIAEACANYGSNKNESTHSKWLQDKFDTLWLEIVNNPKMLSDVVSGSINYMKSSTEDMNEGESNEGDEIFTRKHILDFKDDHKILSPSEKDSSSETITGEVPRTKI